MKKYSFKRNICLTTLTWIVSMVSFAQAHSIAESATPGKRDSTSLINAAYTIFEQHLKNTQKVPDWNWVQKEFARKYPATNVDSLTSISKIIYYDNKGNARKKLNEVVYLTNKYGNTWAPGDLARHTRIVIREDLEYEQDALKWIKMAMAKADSEQEKVDLGITYAYVLAKLGKKKEGLHYVSEALPTYLADAPYMNHLDGTIGYGLDKKRTIGDLFEIEADREVWLYAGGKNQKAARYRGKVSFEEDKQYWEKVRDNYLVKEFNPRAADSVMLIGAMFYYGFTLRDTIAEMAPFVEYSEKYHNRNLIEKNNNAWKVFEKSKKTQELQKALEWSEQTLGDEQYQAYTYGTYANLLYKLGDKAKALDYINRALKLAPDEKMKADYLQTIAKMKKEKKHGKIKQGD